MPSSIGSLEQKLKKLQTEKDSWINAIEEVRELLDKADQRKQANPDEKRRWNRTIDGLEDRLIENKSTLNRCEQQILRMDKELAEAKEREAARKERESQLGETGVSAEDLRSAGELVLSTPLKQIQDLPLQDLALAKTFVQSDLSEGLNKQKRDLLLRKLEACDNPAPASTTNTLTQRRKQILLRQALEKGASDQIGLLTLNDLELIANSFHIVTARGQTDPDSRRLYGVLCAAVTRLNTKCTSLSQVYEKIAQELES